MKGFYQFVVCLAYLHLTAADHYTNKYDNVNLDEVLASERLLSGYVRCLLNEGHCTPDGNELKRNLPDAISNDCSKCTERQREGSDRVMEYIIDHRPNDWIRLEKMYNSDGSYKRKYLERKAATEKSKDEKSTEKSKTEPSKDQPEKKDEANDGDTMDNAEQKD
uniref:Putative chemosensory protein 21 n=1 Tax=Conopomorpha sinensis TaxID=940481 RepID=A0A649ZVB1_9NEOP|nr:putative chemosensory protein 21 [Conopomorpha sinensis]